MKAIVVRTWRIFATAVTIAVLLGVLVEGWFFAHVLWWRSHNPATTSFMEHSLDALRAKNRKARLQQIWVPYNRISVNLKRAVIAAEDAKFTAHEGFDWEGIQVAIEKNQRYGRSVAGGSTISQQLAKNLFLSGERSLVRKAQEAAITVMLEMVMSKQRILELYLNVVEWGNGVYGIEAAARHYYGVSASALNEEQAARLAAMLPRPRYYDYYRDSSYLADYADRILARMPDAQLP